MKSIINENLTNQRETLKQSLAIIQSFGRPRELIGIQNINEFNIENVWEILKEDKPWARERALTLFPHFGQNILNVRDIKGFDALNNLAVKLFGNSVLELPNRNFLDTISILQEPSQTLLFRETESLGNSFDRKLVIDKRNRITYFQSFDLQFSINTLNVMRTREMLNILSKIHMPFDGEIRKQNGQILSVKFNPKANGRSHAKSEILYYLSGQNDLITPLCYKMQKGTKPISKEQDYLPFNENEDATIMFVQGPDARALRTPVKYRLPQLTSTQSFQNFLFPEIIENENFEEAPFWDIYKPKASNILGIEKIES